MAEVTTRVRPRAQYLKQLPTLERFTPDKAAPRLHELAREKGIAFVLELKLVTPTARYWLCTQGLAEARPEVPRGWVVDYITPDYPRPDGGWTMEEAAAYGPQNTPWLQGNDYLQMLTDEYERLQRQQEREGSWQTAQQMEVTQEEMRQVVAQMDAIVQQRQAPRPR
ncbi:MAG: hypothetical protein L0Z62_16805 [Gemmataceae bacterium]|nr:hypothetical protein [Gemmataceae bacterium]